VNIVPIQLTNLILCYLAQQDLSDSSNDRSSSSKANAAERRIEIQPAEDEEGL
jgi:hypothetical protein